MIHDATNLCQIWKNTILAKFMTLILLTRDFLSPGKFSAQKQHEKSLMLIYIREICPYVHIDITKMKMIV